LLSTLLGVGTEPGFYGVGEDGILAFTDFGIENLIELIKMHKDYPTLLNCRGTAAFNLPVSRGRSSEVSVCLQRGRTC
jgi:hypothetical protein